MLLKTLGAANATIIIVPILVIVIVALGVYLLISLRQKVPRRHYHVYLGTLPTLNHEAVFASRYRHRCLRCRWKRHQQTELHLNY